MHRARSGQSCSRFTSIRLGDVVVGHPDAAVARGGHCDSAEMRREI